MKVEITAQLTVLLTVAGSDPLAALREAEVELRRRLVEAFGGVESLELFDIGFPTGG